MAAMHKRRGRALIIANSVFDKATLKERKGTEVDLQQLNSVLEWLNFKVDVRRNLTSDVSQAVFITEPASAVVSMCTVLLILSSL